jgi:hypothetical protein
MPPDRVKRLEEIGFEWTTKDPRKVPWDQRYKDLKQFVKTFGHSDVPHEWEVNPQLGFWVANQRQQYRYLQLGKKSSLTEDRIKMLNDIGFVWKMQGGRRKKSDPVARPNQGGTGSDASVSSSETSQDCKPLLLDAVTSSGTKRKANAIYETNYSPPPAVDTKQHSRIMTIPKTAI